MATQRQKKLARAIVDNVKAKEPKNGMQLLISAGYDEVTARASSTRTIEQQGVQEELIKYGFTEEKAKETVVKIIDNYFVAPADKLKAADMIFKVHGSYAPDKSINLNANINAPITPKVKEVMGKFEEELFNTLANE